MFAKKEWIYKKTQELKKRLYISEIFEKEGKILFLGEKKSLHVKSLVSFYKEATKEIVLSEIEKLSKSTSLYPSKISFRKTKRRWGSCNYKNELNFTITLSQLPIECIRYIILHELTHIKYKNHQKEFYAFIKRHMSNYKELEKEIKTYSPMV